MKIVPDLVWSLWLELVFSKDGPPDLRTRLLLAAFAVRLREDERCPSIAVLARMSTLSPHTVAKLMSDATQIGWLTAEQLRRVQMTDDALRQVTCDDLVTLQ
jgi:DNA-binding transcriptional regulator YhcF (GntR family)